MGLPEEVDQLIADIKADGERMQQRMREAALRGAAAVAAEKGRWRQWELRPQSSSGALQVRETPEDAYGGRFDRFERILGAIALDVGELRQDVGQVKQDVGQLNQDIGQLKQDVGQLKQDVAGFKADVKERLATKVELEALSHNIAMMADGFNETQRRLSYVADLLKRHVILP